jgi:hypothetical protein
MNNWMRKHAMKNFTVALIEFVVVFGLSLASAAMLSGLFIGALNPKIEPVADLKEDIAMQYRIHQ